MTDDDAIVDRVVERLYPMGPVQASARPVHPRVLTNATPRAPAAASVPGRPMSVSEAVAVLRNLAADPETPQGHARRAAAVVRAADQDEREKTAMSIHSQLSTRVASDEKPKDDEKKKTTEDAIKLLRDALDDPESTDDEKKKAKKMLEAIEDEEKEALAQAIEARLGPEERAVLAKLDAKPRPGETRAASHGATLSMPGRISAEDARKRAAELERQMKGGGR
jgi:hypothetical protein